jgi:hypothetical protein
MFGLEDSWTKPVARASALYKRLVFWSVIQHERATSLATKYNPGIPSGYGHT